MNTTFRPHEWGPNSGKQPSLLRWTIFSISVFAFIALRVSNSGWRLLLRESLQQAFNSKTSIENGLETNCGRKRGRIASCGRQMTAVTATFNSSGSPTGALCPGTLPVRTMLSRLRNTENTVSPSQVRTALLGFSRNGLDADPNDETHVAAYMECRKLMDRVSASAFRQYLNNHKRELMAGSR